MYHAVFPDRIRRFCPDVFWKRFNFDGKSKFAIIHVRDFGSTILCGMYSVCVIVLGGEQPVDFHLQLQA